MRVALHILTHPDDTLAQQIIATHREQPDQEVHVVDLTAGEPDYAGLLQAIFAADSVAVW